MFRKLFLITLLAGFLLVSPLKAQTPAETSTVTAVNDLKRSLETLLNILIGKAGLLQAVPFVGAPIAGSLRQLEATTESLLFILVDKPCLNSAGLDRIRSLTTKVNALQGPAQSITILSGTLILIGQGPFPVIISGINEIINDEAVDISYIQPETNIPPCNPVPVATTQASITEAINVLNPIFTNAISAYEGLRVN